MSPDNTLGRPFLRDGVISLAALLLAYAALDDITTDNATSFTGEYLALVACAAWFAFLAVRWLRRHYSARRIV